MKKMDFRVTLAFAVGALATYFATVKLMVEFTGNLVQGAVDAQYSGAFLVGLCGFLTLILTSLAMILGRIKPELDGRATWEKHKATDAVLRKMMGTLASEIALTIFLVLLANTVGLTLLVYDLSVVVISTLHAVAAIKSRRTKMPGEDRVTTIVLLLALICNSWFWLVYAYAFGVWPYLAWATVKLVGLGLLRPVLKFCYEVVIKQQEEKDEAGEMPKTKTLSRPEKPMNLTRWPNRLVVSIPLGCTDEQAAFYAASVTHWARRNAIVCVYSLNEAETNVYSIPSYLEWFESNPEKAERWTLINPKMRHMSRIVGTVEFKGTDGSGWNVFELTPALPQYKPSKTLPRGRRYYR